MESERRWIGMLLRVLPVLGAVVVPGVVVGQEVTGTVVLELDGSPVVGAVVELRDTAGRQHGASLTRADGTYVVRAGAPGPYRLAVGAMGYRTVVTEAFELSSGEVVTRDLVLPLEPVRLADLRATRERRCGRPEGVEASGGGDLARLWEHARRGLLAVRITESADGRTFVIRRREVDQDTRRRVVLSDTIWTFTARGRNPFQRAPADRLMRDGFVGIVADTIVYNAPDAELVLSDAFLDTHCFRLVPGPSDSALVGLAFAPIERRRDRTDIEGTLWVSEATAELRRLEFGYLDPPLGWSVVRPRGELNFERLEDGTWIVRQWWIMFERPGVRRGRLTRRPSGVHTSSGRVIGVLP